MKKKIFIAIVFILFVDSFFLERYFVRFPEIEFRSEKIPEEFDGYRIAIISDLHLGLLDPEFWIRDVLEKTNRQGVDLIVGIGDYVKKRRHDSELMTVWPLLNELKARDGAYFVNGNHDHWANSDLALALLERSGKSLRHRSRVFKRKSAEIVIAGTGDYWEDEVGIDKSLRGTTADQFRIILSHNPDAADTAHNQRVDLFITGHTHGGQVRIPFFNYSPVLPVKNKIYDRGFKANSKGEIVFISGGIGWSILPVRLFCPAEIPILILRSTKELNK